MSSPLVHNRGNFNWIRRCVRAHSTRREKWWLRSKMVDTKSWLFFVCVLSTWALSFCANDFLVAQLNSTQWDNDSEKLSHKFNELPEWLRIFFLSPMIASNAIFAQFAQVETNGHNANVFNSQFAKLSNSSLNTFGSLANSNDSTVIINCATRTLSISPPHSEC